MSYQTLATEITGSLPGLPFPLAQTFVQRAWDDLRRERLWSFLITETSINFPVQVTTGTMTTVAGATTMTADAAATAALTGLVNPAITQRQIRIQGGQLYNISNFVGSTITIDRTYADPFVGAGLPYQVYVCYFFAPSADFLKWDSLEDFQNGYAITKGRLSLPKEEIDRRDPQRMSQGLGYFVGTYASNQANPPPFPASPNQAIYELWPHPVQGQVFEVTYRKLGLALPTPASVQSNIISDTLLMLRALIWHAYPWAQANRGNHPAFEKVDFLGLIREKRPEYVVELGKAKKVDDEVSLQRVYNRGRSRWARELVGPADARYWQGHPITW